MDLVRSKRRCEKIYKIGQLADKAGISIRTLRYYDELKILKPSYVSEAGYRYYNHEDIMKLHHIAMLKQLGFTLPQIRTLFEEEAGWSRAERWTHEIRLQLNMINKEKKKLAMLERMLHTTLRTIELREDIPAEELLLFIHSLQMADGENAVNSIQRENRRQQFTSDELPIIEALPRLDSDDHRADEWIHLLRDIRDHLGEPPNSPKSRQLAKRVLELGEQWFQGREDVQEKYWDWIRPEPGGEEKVLGLDEATMAYMDRIVDEYLREDQTAPSDKHERK
ncbi:MerR family transcriptional regulator [Paenibacillus donghaensis]|uniref:MerR family transcriptional regulator n=1 Tax=Paenibacillus donghaensis TaxID=414771 RepID=UPI001884287F|nr:MerR family transcriptional regulator [Paenibacillus donghaensis]MBE9915502.1 MerR family transcriptional regulator [Paenibacillus donghaensis]